MAPHPFDVAGKVAVVTGSTKGIGRAMAQGFAEAGAKVVVSSRKQELCTEGIKHGLFHRFESGGRLALGAISWLNIETRTKSLIVQAFHTFPDDLAIVKSQSLFEVP